MHDRHDLSDEQWELIAPHLPDSHGRRGGQWADHRRVINGVLWRVRAGAPWRDLPASYGPWKTVYNRHRLWSADGTWESILSELRADSDSDFDEWLVSVDGTIVRAHHHAAGARHAPPKDVPPQRLAPMPLEVAARPTTSTGGRSE